MMDKSKRVAVKARNAVFTCFVELPSDDSQPPLLKTSDWPDVKYCVYQVEKCPKTNKLHYQGYLEFVGQKTWKWVHKYLVGLEKAHLEVRRGSQSDAIDYCKKSESRVSGPYEMGEKR